MTLKSGSVATKEPPMESTSNEIDDDSNVDSDDSSEDSDDSDDDGVDDATDDMIGTTTDASSNDGFDTTPSSNDEQETMTTESTMSLEEIRSNSIDDDEQRRRNEIQEIFASKEFNGTNPSYLQIINNSPTLLVYATTQTDRNATYDENSESNLILTTEQPTEQPTEQSTDQSTDQSTEQATELRAFEDSTKFDMDEMVSTQSPTSNELNANEFVSTMEHDNVTDVHHGVKRQSIYDAHENDDEDDDQDYAIRQPEYYETGNDYDEFDEENEPADADDEYLEEIEDNVDHKARITAVQSVLSTIQKQRLATAHQKPVINRFNTLEQMVENSKQQFGSPLRQTVVRNRYNNLKPQISTTTTTTTTTKKPKEHEVRKSNRRYLQRQLPVAVAVESSTKAQPKTAPLPTNGRKSRLRTKSTIKNVEYESSSPSVTSSPKPEPEFHESSSKLQTAVERRTKLFNQFNAKRRNILFREVTTPQTPVVDETAEMEAATTNTAPIILKSKQHSESTTTASATTRKPNRSSASYHRFRLRQNQQTE